MLRFFSRSILLSLFFVIPASAQVYTYGSSTELKGLSKVFINSQVVPKYKKRIIRALLRSKTGLTVVDKVEQADIVIAFGSDKDRWVMKYHRNEFSGPWMFNEIEADFPYEVGIGFVFVRGSNDKTAARMVHRFWSVQDKLGELSPVDRFTGDFIKLFKTANNLIGD